MNKIGKLLGATGDLVLDVKKLIVTRLLVVANSGGGKSHLLRKLIELCFGQVQIIVLDVEGDFASLRAKYDFILAGKGGDIPVDIRSAEMLATKTLELGVSLIADLYELKKHERIIFVKRFLEAMVDAPKSLWHPVLVVIDEAHIFCPEKDKAESAGAVIDLATRGRKRGFAVLLATQRLSKLHKDAAAECINKLIGRTGLDIDMKRAADDLGFSSREQVHSLRNLNPGEFYGYGPALSKEIVTVMVDPTITKHPKAGQRGESRAPLPTAKIKSILAKLTDLPKEAQQQAQTMESLKFQVRELEAQARRLTHNLLHQPASKPVIDKAAIERDLSQARAQGIAIMQAKARKLVDEHFGKLKQDLAAQIHKEKLEPVRSRVVEAVTPFKVWGNVPTPSRLAPGHHGLSDVQALRKPAADPDAKWGRCELAILGFLSGREKPMTKLQVAAMTGYSHSSGGFNNSLSKLASNGLIRRSDDKVAIADEAAVRGILGADFEEPKPMALTDWLKRLGACERKIYELLMSGQDQEFSKEEIAQTAGYSASSGGFNNSLSRLCSLGLALRKDGKILFNPELHNL